MRLDFSNVGKGLTAIAQAKMDADVAGLRGKNTPYRQYSPEQAAQMTTAQSIVNPETGRPYYEVGQDSSGSYTFDAGGGLKGNVSPQYAVGDQNYATQQEAETAARGLSDPAVRDYWASKGSVGEERVKALDEQRAAGLQSKVAQNELDKQEREKSKAGAIEKSFESSRFFQVKERNKAAQAKYEADLAEVRKLPPEQQVGKLPIRPAEERISPIEAVRDQMEALAVRQAHGEDVSGPMAEAAGVIKKIKDEGVVDALNVAHETGDPVQIAEAYNRSGSEQMDPSRIKTKPVTITVNGKKVHTYEVTIDEGQGKPPHTSYAYNDLIAAIGADKAFERAYKQQMADAASATAKASEKKATSDKYSFFHTPDGKGLVRASTEGNFEKKVGNKWMPADTDKMDLAGLVPFSAGRGVLTPEMQGEYQKRMADLGARPADKNKAAVWDAEARHIKTSFGVVEPVPKERMVRAPDGSIIPESQVATWKPAKLAPAAPTEEQKRKAAFDRIFVAGQANRAAGLGMSTSK